MRANLPKCFSYGCHGYGTQRWEKQPGDNRTVASISLVSLVAVVILSAFARLTGLSRNHLFGDTTIAMFHNRTRVRKDFYATPTVMFAEVTLMELSSSPNTGPFAASTCYSLSATKCNSPNYLSLPCQQKGTRHRPDPCHCCLATMIAT
jgi:hypothetical protein